MKVVLKYSPLPRRYRDGGQRKMLRALGSDLASQTTWFAVDIALHGEIAEVPNRTPRVRKLAHYLPIYAAEVDQTRPIRMLEIASFYDDSLRVWQEYLHPDSVIIGIDINSMLVTVADSTGIHVRIGAERNVSSLCEVAAEFGPFDVILDAGSQTSSHMVDSFRRLFRAQLSYDGIYLVEDVYCNYWSLYNRFSFMDVGRALVDVLNGHYRVVTDEAKFRVGQVVVVRRATQACR